jgi:hypothetical protein
MGPDYNQVLSDIKNDISRYGLESAARFLFILLVKDDGLQLSEI